MIITTIEELRMQAPAHALDNLDGITGFIDNSEHDFLQPYLGLSLYKKLQEWYDEQPDKPIEDDGGCFYQLLRLAQRCVGFDTLGRAVDIQMLSVNNAGVNQLSASDYERPDKNGIAVANYKQTCIKEAHAAVNQLLRTLEVWCKEVGAEVNSESSDDTDEQKQQITTLWQESDYYYLAAALLIPSCEVLQSYINIYDSREKFIQMLPDLRFIQEEQVAPAIGEELAKTVVAFARDSKLPKGASEGLEPILTRLVHRLRKVEAAYLVERTSVIKYNKEQKIAAHDDGVRMMGTLIEYLRQHQEDFPEDMVKDAPWYVKPAPEPKPGDKHCCHEHNPEEPPTDMNNRPGSAMFVTPPLL